MNRQVLASAVLFAFFSRASLATPLMVARTQTSIVIGTNAVNSVGLSTCKVHLARNVVVLRATSTVEYTDKNGHVTIDLDRDLDHDLTGKSFTRVTLRQAVVASTESSLRKFTAMFPPPANIVKNLPLKTLSNNFILAGYEVDGSPFVQAFTLNVLNTDPISFRQETKMERLEVGEFWDWSGGVARELTFDKTEDSAVSLTYSRLDGVYKSNKELGGNKSFDPPYIVMRLSPKAPPTYLRSSRPKFCPVPKGA